MRERHLTKRLVARAMLTPAMDGAISGRADVLVGGSRRPGMIYSWQIGGVEVSPSLVDDLRHVGTDLRALGIAILLPRHKTKERQSGDTPLPISPREGAGHE